MIFHGLVSSDSISGYMEESDVLFAQIGHKFQFAIPTKVFEYIASGRRVLLGLPDGPAKEVFKEFKGVEIFSASNFNEMKESYERLVSKNFGNEERNFNLNRLKASFIREENMSLLLSKLDDISRRKF